MFAIAACLCHVYFESIGDDMPPRRNATGIIYFAGAVLILDGAVQFINGPPLLAIALVIMGAILIVLRYLQNRRL